MNRSIVDMNDRIDVLEEVDDDYPVDEILDTIADIRRNCLALKRYMSPQHEALLQITRDAPPWLSETNRRDIRETIDRLSRYIEDLDVSKESALVIQDDINNRATAQSNKTIYMLSIIAAIFLPLELLYRAARDQRRRHTGDEFERRILDHGCVAGGRAGDPNCNLPQAAAGFSNAPSFDRAAIIEQVIAFGFGPFLGDQPGNVRVGRGIVGQRFGLHMRPLALRLGGLRGTHAPDLQGRSFVKAQTVDWLGQRKPASSSARLPALSASCDVSGNRCALGRAYPSGEGRSGEDQSVADVMMRFAAALRRAAMRPSAAWIGGTSSCSGR